MTKIIRYFCASLFTVSLGAAAGDATAGKAVYEKACKACHGADGTPNPAIAKTMKVDMSHLGDPSVQKLSDDELRAICINGKGKMKPVKGASGKAVNDVIAYMRTLKK